VFELPLTVLAEPLMALLCPETTFCFPKTRLDAPLIRF
jgi:hypothetical protein